MNKAERVETRDSMLKLSPQILAEIHKLDLDYFDEDAESDLIDEMFLDAEEHLKCALSLLENLPCEDKDEELETPAGPPSAMNDIPPQDGEDL